MPVISNLIKHRTHPLFVFFRRGPGGDLFGYLHHLQQHNDASFLILRGLAGSRLLGQVGKLVLGCWLQCFAGNDIGHSVDQGGPELLQASWGQASWGQAI